jgi:uncharacterized protein (UPF0332 family)
VGRSFYIQTEESRRRPEVGVLSKFGLEFVNEGEVEEYYGRALRIAEELREEANYSISREITKEEVESIMDDAEKFLERIKRAVRELN